MAISGTHNDIFVINDIILRIPPTDIHISKKSFNSQWQTLRTNNSQKTKSGHAVIDIQFTVAFVGERDINDRLRPLIAELRYMPFCYVDNQFIRENLFPMEHNDINDDTKTTIVLAMRAMNISIKEGMPNTIMATFSMSYFNYLPFINLWKYKDTLFGDGADKSVASPLESRAWGEFMSPAINETSPVVQLEDQSTDIQFVELRTGLRDSKQNLEQTKEILKSFSDGTVAKKFLEEVREEVSSNPVETLRQAIKRTIPQFSDLDDLAASDVILPVVVDAGPRSNPKSPKYNKDGNFFDQTKLDNAIKEIDTRINQRGDLDKIITEGFTLLDDLSFMDNRGNNYGIYHKLRGFKLAAPDIIISEINISITNILASIPILSHRYATFQHIGSIDAVVELNIKATSDQAMKTLSWFYDTVNENMLSNRHIPQDKQTIKLHNPVLQLFNLEEFITQDMSVDTIPGMPGTYNINLSLIESGLKRRDQLTNDQSSVEKFKLEYAANDSAVIREIVNILDKYIILYKPINSVQAFTTVPLNNNDGLFNNVVKNYLYGFSRQNTNSSVLSEQSKVASTSGSVPGYQSLANDILREIYKDDSLYTILLGLTENDHPGISKIQEYIDGWLRQKNATQLSSLFFQQTRQESLATVIERARTKLLRDQDAERVRKTRALSRQLNYGSTEDPVVQLENTDVFELENRIGGRIAPSQNKFKGTERPISELLYSDQLKNIASKLLQSDAIIKFDRFLSMLVEDILNTEAIDLPQFASVKAMVDKIGLGRGLPAYPDFKLERLLEGDDADNIDKILSTDPDCFLFSSESTDIDDYIDPVLFGKAKEFALTSYNSSVDKVKDFFTNDWIGGLLQPFMKNKIEENMKISIPQKGKGALTKTGLQTLDNYYRNPERIDTFLNAGSTGQVISLTSNDIDKNGTRTISAWNEHLKAMNSVGHTLNPKNLFIGDLLFASKEDAVAADNLLDNINNIAKDRAHSKVRGKRVTRSTSVDGIVQEDPVKLAIQAGVKLETYALARCIASESSDTAEKIGIGWAIWNEALGNPKYNGSILETLTKSRVQSGKFGSQFKKRFASTIADPYDQDIKIAQGILGGSIPDPTGGARRFFSPKSQDSASAQKNIAAKGGKVTKSAQEILEARAKEGWAATSIAGVDPRNLIFFRKSNTMTMPTAGAGSGGGAGAGLSVAEAMARNFSISLANGQVNRLVRAFPTFKFYFIQDDSGNRRRYGADDLFSYNAVVNIKCVRSRKIPSDLVEITITNVSGNLTNRKYQASNPEVMNDKFGTEFKPKDESGKNLEHQPNKPLLKDTIQENPLASLLVQIGMDVELRLGYSNDPDKLTTVFDGKIMEIEFSDSDDLITLICQSHAIELVQDIKGMEKPKKETNFLSNDANTDNLLEKMIAEPEVRHFGRWVRSKTVKDGNTNRQLLTNKYTLQPRPQDDNIFSPSQKELDKLDSGWFFDDLTYYIYQTTIWDIFDEMTLRHPGWIKSAVPYKGKEGPRMTMFFGLPSQLYFAADPSTKEKNMGNAVKKVIETSNKAIDADKDTKDGITRTGNINVKPDKRDYARERLDLAKDFQSIKPFRAYHLVTSKHHIISNTIRASSKNTFNTISIQYEKATFNSKTQQLVQEDADIFTLKVDAALPEEDVRELFKIYNNCQNKMLAKNYALALLMRELKDAYKGELVIIGNPDIKPYDIVYIMDDYCDILGPIEVEQVIHSFSQETGFITEITPDLFVTANEWVNMTAADMMSVIIEGTASSLIQGTPVTNTEHFFGSSRAAGALTAGLIGLALLSPIAAIIGGGIALAGYFTLNKLVDFTDYGQPVVMHPLLHRGKPFIAGLPIRKLNNLWAVNKGEWFKQGFEGIGLALDDFQDKLTFAPGQGDLGNIFSGNTLPPNFD